MKLFLKYKLNLKVKDNYQIFLVDSRGIDFVGYVMRHNYCKVRKSIKVNMFKVIKLYQSNYIQRDELKRKITSYLGWLKFCNSKHLLQKIQDLTSLEFSNFCGKKDNISNYKNKEIYLIHIDKKDKYYNIQFIYKGNPIQVKSRNKLLFNTLKDNKLPTIITLK